MAQYKIPDPEEMVLCPYNKVHMIRAKRLQYHLMKCRKNYIGSDFATCPFNARHEMPKPELRYHLANCPDKAVIEPMLAYESSKRNGEEASMFRGCVDLPVYEHINIESEENWDAEIPSVARIGVDPQYFARQDNMIIPGLSRSEKKEFARQMHLPAESRSYVAQYSEPSDYDHLKDEQPKLRLPKTAAQTYLPNQKKSVQLTSTVFAYSLSMAGVGRGLPAGNQNGSGNGSVGGVAGQGRGRGRGTTVATGRGTTMAQMNGLPSQPLGMGVAYQNGHVPDAASMVHSGPQSTVRSENQSSSPVFSVGIGRGSRATNGTTPPSFVVPTIPQQNHNGYVKDEEGSEDSMEDLNKKLKKIEKKLRQIDLLETKVDEGHTLTAEEAAKVAMKGKLSKQRESLQQKSDSN